MPRLTDKVAIVTGGASGIGKGVAARLASEGARVFITDVQSELGAQAAKEIGCAYLEQDVADEARWAELVAEVEKAAGRLDILVNNAGILGGVNSTPENETLAHWRKVLSINLDGVFLGCRTAIPAMRRAGGGAIVNISSITAHMGTMASLPYGASKAAVQQLTRSVAEYCARNNYNIRCNSVHPGFIHSAAQHEGNKQIAELRGIPLETVVASVKSRVPLGDYGTPEDIGAAVAYLVSDDARYVTGAKLLVDGGVIMD